MRKTVFVIAIVMALILAACGGQSSGPVVGDVERGKQLYNQSTLGSKSAEGCVSCHNYDEAEGDDDKAPYTKGTATRAESRVPGMTAEEYIQESIVKPDAYIVEGFNEGDMYQTWTEELSEQQMADLVAYLLTEK
jgi:cytochrome c553